MHAKREEHNNTEGGLECGRVRLTAHLTMNAYDAIVELQRQYLKKTGRSIPKWKLLDSAIIEYAKNQGIEVGESPRPQIIYHH